MKTSVKLATLTLAVASVGTLAACATDTPADIVSHNISQEAEKFEVRRQVVFTNNITGAAIKEVDGFCNIEVDTAESQLEVTCLADRGRGLYLKHFQHLSETTGYTVEQLDPSAVSKDHYVVIINPSAMIPTFDVE